MSLREIGESVSRKFGGEPIVAYRPSESPDLASEVILPRGEWRFSYDLNRSGQDEINGNLDLKSVNNGRTAVVSLKRVK